MKPVSFNNRPIDEKKIADIVTSLTLEEKVAMCHANTKFTSTGVERLGIPDVCYSDGPHGVREEIAKDSWAPAGWDNDYSTALPCGMALASTWNPEMGALFGHVLGAETRYRNKDVILAPGFNIVRHPLNGRNFEYLSEDPHLICEMAVTEIKAIQEHDVAACAKHFAANNQEMNRFKVDVDMSERALRELYLPGFKASVQRGGAMTIMGSYNRFRGQWCCHNHYLLQDILKEEWGFKGLVVSDWNGVSNTAEAAANGLDVEMGTELGNRDHFLGPEYLKGLKEGIYSEEDLNDKVTRILRVLMAVGLQDKNRKAGAFNTLEHQQATRFIAQEAMVLLKNDKQVLPMNLSKIKTVAVIGENALLKSAYGGGSSEIKAKYQITALEGIKNACGKDVEVVFASGYPDVREDFSSIPTECLGAVDDGSGISGWKTEFMGAHGQGDVKFQRTDQEINTDWFEETKTLPEIVGDAFFVRYTATITAPKSGEYSFTVKTDQGFNFSIDDEVKMQFWECKSEVLNRNASVELEEGKQYKLVLQQQRSIKGKRLQFGWNIPSEELSHESSMNVALTAAKEADAVIFVGGLTKHDDSEGKDRPHMRLPLGQDEVIEALAEVNANTAVVLLAGSPVEMPWIDKVSSVVLGWYAGMESGNALADLLFGKVNPSGKLPVTFPKKLEDTPAATVGEYKADSVYYNEGIFVGYRWYDAKNIEPLFPFGHGLSYTSFEYSDLSVQNESGAIEIRGSVKNSGAVVGKEIVQVYVGKKETVIERAPKELKGFRKLEIQPGESSDFSINLTADDLAYFNEDKNDWSVENGSYEVYVGSSSRDIRLQGLILDVETC